MTYTLLEDKDWGMRWARPPVAQVMPVSEVYVHHTAGADPADPPPYDDDAATAFFNLNEAAINVKGYSATDYSMLIHTAPWGETTIGEARGQWTPAATKDRNTESKAVCIFGYFHPPNPAPGYEWTYQASRRPFRSELEAAAWAIVWMIEQGWVVKKPIIRGHRDNPEHPNATACPGDYLEQELWQIRMFVDQYQLTPEPPSGDDDMGKVIIDFQRTDANGKKYSGGSFTLDGIPLDGPVREELIKQGWKAVFSSHPYWREAVAFRNGAAAERLYVEFEDSQDTVKD